MGTDFCVLTCFHTCVWKCPQSFLCLPSVVQPANGNYYCCNGWAAAIVCIWREYYTSCFHYSTLLKKKPSQLSICIATKLCLTSILLIAENAAPKVLFGLKWVFQRGPTWINCNLGTSDQRTSHTEDTKHTLKWGKPSQRVLKVFYMST